MNQKIKVALVDDHNIILTGIKALLGYSDDIEVVGVASNGSEIVELVKTIDIDVILMDINMPLMDGIEATRLIHIENPTIGVIALTVNDDEVSIRKMLEAGAKGYILKDDEEKVILNGIKEVFAGNNFFSSNASSKFMTSLMGKTPTKETESDKYDVDLTDRELQILKLIGGEFTSTEIALKLDLSTRTVDVHRRNLIKKLDVRNSLGLVKYAIRSKLID